MGNLVCYGQSPGQDLNPGPTEYEVAMLTNQVLCLVPFSER
jgi:hypothetical protein